MDKIKIKPGNKFKIIEGFRKNEIITVKHEALNNSPFDFKCINGEDWFLSQVIPYTEVGQHQGHPEIYENLIEETLKFDEGKTCLSDVPQLSLMSVAKVFNYGSKKYSKFNYSGGTFWLRYYDACQRHLNSWMVGEDIDESTNHHLDHAIASLMMLRENIHLNKGTDDRNKTYKISK